MSENQEAVQEEEIFDERVKPLPLKVRRASDGKVITYIVCESDGGDDFWKFMKDMDAINVVLRENKTPDDNYYDVLCRLLVLVVRQEDGSPVEANVIKGWGLKLKDKAFKMAQEQNGIGAKAADKAGKSSGDADQSTTGTESPVQSEAQSSKPNDPSGLENSLTGGSLS